MADSIKEVSTKLDESTKAVSYKETHAKITLIQLRKKKMAKKQISQNKFITNTVAKVTRVAIQTMVMVSTLRQEYRTHDEWIHNKAAYIQLGYKGQR